MRRVFINGALAAEMEIVGDDAHHLMRVLRCKIGDRLTVADARREAAEAEIVGFTARSVRLRLVRILAADAEPPVEVALAQCLLKTDKMDWIVQKAVELGVDRICPVASENCVVRYNAEKCAARRQKWQKIAAEAAKQCGRGAVPTVEPVRPLAALLEATPDLRRLFCYEREDAFGLRAALRGVDVAGYLLLVGPEGGFSPQEAALCQSAGALAVSLGPRILRAETAALAALSAVLYEKGDLGGKR